MFQQGGGLLASVPSATVKPTEYFRENRAAYIGKRYNLLNLVFYLQICKCNKRNSE